MSEKANTVLQAAADKPADAEAPAADATVGCLRPAQRRRSGAAEAPPTQQTVAMAIGQAGCGRRSPSGRADNNDSSTWDKTSLIGKIFIAFGALLTMASAARMFMA